MRRAVAVAVVALLAVLWPVATAGAAAVPADGSGEGAPATDGVRTGGESTAGDRVGDSANASGDDGRNASGDDGRNASGSEDPASAGAGAGADSGERRVHRDPVESTLANATTSADGEPAVGGETTVTLSLTAVTDVSNLTVSLPDYRFVAGDDREFAVGDVAANETRRVNVTVEPTEAVARYLRFALRGTTQNGTRVQHVSHDLAVVDRANHTTGLVVDASRPAPDEIPDTTIDPWGNRSVRGGAADGGGAGTAPDVAAGASGAPWDGAGDGRRRADAASAAAAARVSGCFSYQGQGNNPSLHPGRQLRVEVYDADRVFDDHLATGRTSDNGCFDIRVADPNSADTGSNPADVYVAVYADNPAARVERDGWPSDPVYRVEYPAGGKALRNGERLALGGSSRFVPASGDPAFQAADWSLETRRFFERGAGFTRSKVQIHYPESDWPAYQWPDDGERMLLPKRSTADWDRGTIHHEYGHALMDAMYDHSEQSFPDLCPNSQSSGCIDGHAIYSETNPGFAIVEGWAEFVEAAMYFDRTNDYWFYNITGREMNVERNEWFNISHSGDSVPGADTGDMDGNSHEGSVASILFDLYDPVGEDNVDVGLKAIFETVENNEVQSMRHFLTTWKRGHDEALATIASRYGIAIADPYEPNGRRATATPIGFGTLNGTVENGTDFYEVTVPKWTEATVDLSRLYSLSDVTLDMVVYDSDGDVAGFTNPSTNNPVTLPTTGKSAETFYIEVRSAQGHASYRLDVTGRRVDDGFENNDDLAAATPVSGDGAELDPRFATDSRDVYAVELVDGGTLDVSVERDVDDLGPGVDASDVYRVTLFDTDGDYVDDAVGSTGAAAVNLTADEPGFYKVGISVPSALVPVSYDMRIESAPPENDIHEPNDDRSSAVYPAFYPVEGVLVTGEEDWYRRVVTDGSEFRVDVPAVRDERVTVQVFDPTGWLVGTTFDGGSVVDRDANGGVYRIRVATRPHNTVEYTLSVDEDTTPDIDPPADRFENNDDFATATAVGRRLSAEGLSMRDGDDDYYQIGLNAGDRLRVNLSYNASLSTGGLGLSLFGPGQTPLRNAGLGLERSLTVQQDGVYYVEVSGTGDDDLPYALTIEGNDGYEDNDERASAAQYPFYSDPFESGFVLADALNASHVAGEDDWYQVTLDADERLSAAVRPTETNPTSGLPRAYLNVSIYDSRGTLLAQSGPNGGATYDLTTGGTYYLRVHPWQNNTYTSDYTLSVDRSADPANATNADVANATYYVPSDANRTFELADASDEDTYAVYLQRGDGLEVDLSVAGPSDVDVTVLEPDQSVATATVTTPSNDVNLSADTIATADGYYYVRVHGAFGRTRYTLSLDRVTDDRFEPNDGRRDAARIGFQTVEGRLFAGPGTFGAGVGPDETDHYELRVRNATTVRARLVFDQVDVGNSTVEDGSDLDLAVLDASGAVLAANGSLTDNATVRAALPSAGTYYLRVNATGLDTVTPYRLVVERAAAPVADPGAVERYIDTPRTTVAGSLPASPSDALSLAPGQNVSYGVQLRAGERLTVTSATDGPVDLALYDAAGRLLTGRRGVTNGSLSYVAASNGSFYVEATAAGTTPVSLSLSAATATPGNDRYEPNDGVGGATPLSPGEFDGLELDTDDVDYYAVSLRRGQRLTVDPAPRDLDGTLELAVLGPAGAELATAAGADPAPAVHTAGQAGTYYVRVDGGEETAGTYALDVGVETPGNDRFEPNGGIESAKSLSAGTYDGLRVATGDRDVFAVELADDEQLYADLRFDQTEGNLDLRLYGPEGELAATSASDTDGESATVEADGEGTYYVDVRGYRGASAGYGLALRTEGVGGADRFEPNGVGDPTAVGTGTYDGLSVVDGDVDVFATELPPGGRLSATATFDALDGNVELAVAGPDGERVGAGTSVTANESVSVTAADGGVYTVAVYTRANASAAYALELAGDATAPDDPPGNETGEEEDEPPTEGSETLAVDAPERVAPGGNATIAVSANATGELLVEAVPANWTVTGTEPAGLTTVPNPDDTPATSAAGDTWGHVFASAGNRTFALTVTAPEETGTYSFTAVAVRNGTETTREFAVEVAERSDHESGVPRRTFETAAGGDDELEREDVLAMVRQYVQTGSLEGVPLSRAEVLALVRYYVAS